MSTNQRERLARMAEQIARNLGAERDPDGAVQRTADHLRRFWTAQMQAQLLHHSREDGAGLSPVALRALAELRKE